MKELTYSPGLVPLTEAGRDRRWFVDHTRNPGTAHKKKDKRDKRINKKKDEGKTMSYIKKIWKICRSVEF